MGSMNWLGFSLSPQELPASQSHHHHHHHQDHHSQTSGFNSDEISGTDVSGECFDLASDSAAPSLNLPPPFGIFEAFNRNNQPQDWNMKGLGMNYKTTSEFCMLMGTTPSPCSSSQDLENQQQHQPKLENLLGRHSSFADHDHAAAYNNGNTGDYMFPSCSLQLPSEAAAAETPNVGASGGGNINGNNSSSIGLSMIKTWLRNQPAPTPQENKNDGGATTTAQTLSLSMSTGSQSSSALSLLTSGGGGGGGGGDSSSSDNKQQPRTSTNGSDPALDSQSGAIVTVPRKSVDTFGQRTSIYRGVTRHRWTGRYEAHLWDNSCRREGQTRKGRQVYLGGYDKEEKAARAYDLAALKYWGTTTTTNFPISNYEKEVEEMKHMTRQEYVASLRRKSSGFSRGASIYRGVTRHHQHGRWQARIGRVAGNKDLYLGTFSTQEEAAEAYDIAAIKFRGLNAVTNFDMSRYDVKSILESSTLPIGGAAKRLKDVDHQAEITVHTHRTEDDNLSSQLTDGINNYGAAATNNHGWPALAFQQSHQPFSMQYPYQRVWCKQEVQDSDNHGYQDHLHHQYQTSTTGTHNFFHQPNSVLHNLMGMDSTTAASNMEQHSSGSNNNSVIYGNGGHHDHHDHDHHGDGNGGVLGYGIPMATVISNENQNHGNGNNIVGFGDQSQVKAAAASLGYENLFGSADPYHGRNLYYLPQQSSVGPVKAAGGYDHQVGSACNNWVPIPIPISTAALPTLGGGPRSSNMAAVCHGAQTFTVWNDT